MGFYSKDRQSHRCFKYPILGVCSFQPKKKNIYIKTAEKLFRDRIINSIEIEHEINLNIHTDLSCIKKKFPFFYHQNRQEKHICKFVSCFLQNYLSYLNYKNKNKNSRACKFLRAVNSIVIKKYQSGICIYLASVLVNSGRSNSYREAIILLLLLLFVFNGDRIAKQFAIHSSARPNMNNSY